MKLLLVLIAMMFCLVSCEETDCTKATKNYQEKLTMYNNSKIALGLAQVSVEQICGIFAKNERAMDVGQACEIQKKGFAAAQVLFNGLKVLVDSAKAVMDSQCTAPAAK